MKIIHTSDWHFGKVYSVGRDYEEDQRFFIDRLCEWIRRKGVEAVLCSGDIYDSARVKGEAIQLFSEVATRLCRDMKVTFIVIAGNHDSPFRLSSYSDLLKVSKLYITGRIESDPEPILLDQGRVAVYSAPYFERSDVIRLFPERQEEIKTAADGARIYFDHIRERMSADRRNIVLSHSHVTGSRLSESDRAARIGHASAIPMDVFEGFDYVALGHIHKAQAIAPHIRYSGSPIPYSFGSEEEQEQEKEKGKGVVLIDTDTMEQTFVPLTLRRKRKSLVGTFDEIMGQREYAEHYVSIKITDRYRSPAMMEELERTFKHIIECYGKSYAERTEDHGLSLKELEAMTDRDILRSFFRTYYGSYELTEEEIQIFCDALQENGEEEPA